MGYESKLYVVEKSKHLNDDGMVWGEVVAMFDLCKCYPVSDKMRKYPNTNAYIYADDGDTKILEDKYGEKLKEIPIKDTIKIIKKAIKDDSSYRRFKPCLKLLENFNLDEWDELVVLHYGY